MKSILFIVALFPVFSFGQTSSCSLGVDGSPFQQLKGLFDKAAPISLGQFPKPTETAFSRWRGKMVNANLKLSDVWVVKMAPIDLQMLVQKADGRWEIVDRVSVVDSDKPWTQTTPSEADERDLGVLVETPDLTETVQEEFPITITFRAGNGVILYHETGTRTPEYYGCYWKE